MLKFGKKSYYIYYKKREYRKERENAHEKSRKKKLSKCKNKAGVCPYGVAFIVVGCFCDYGIGNRGDDYGKRFLQTGKITGTHYESEMLGISFDAPEGFEMSSQDQIDEQLKSSVSFANVMKSTSGRRMEMAAISEKGTSVSVITWNMEGDDMSAEQYVESSKKTVMQQYETKVKFTNDGEIFSKKIAGETYECLKLDFTSDDTKRCSESYVRMVDGYAVLIGIAYGPENTAERNAVLEAVKAL